MENNKFDDGKKCDVIIIGGGIIGSSIAYHLVRQGQSVILFDADLVGMATKAGAGIISAATSLTEDEKMYDLIRLSCIYYPNLIEELKKQTNLYTGYEETEEVVIALDESEIPKFKKSVNVMFKRQKANDYPPKDTLYEIEINEFVKKYPSIRKPKKALVFTQAAKVDGYAFTQALLSVSIKKGLRLERKKADSLLIEKNKCLGVIANGEKYFANTTVIAGGAWSKTFEKKVNLKLPLIPQRGQIIHVKLSDGPDIPVIMSLSDYYSLNWGRQRVVIGATREKDSGFDPQSTVNGVIEILREGIRIIPEVENSSILEVRVGLRPYSTTGRPIMGPVPKIKGLWIATGHGPLGLTAGPYSGKLIADSIIHDKLDPFLEHFNLNLNFNK